MPESNGRLQECKALFGIIFEPNMPFAVGLLPQKDSPGSRLITTVARPNNDSSNKAQSAPTNTRARMHPARSSTPLDIPQKEGSRKSNTAAPRNRTKPADNTGGTKRCANESEKTNR